MPIRNWTQQQRETQSTITTSIQPWLHSTGAKTTLGKHVVRYNPMKSGYFKETYREFRKRKRSSETRNIEKLIREAGKTKEDAEFFNLIELIKSKLDEYYDGMILHGLSPHGVMEATYLICLVRTTINHCVTARVIEDLHLHKEGNHDGCSPVADPTC